MKGKRLVLKIVHETKVVLESGSRKQGKANDFSIQVNQQLKGKQINGVCVDFRSTHD
jgi:hypothetical protein